MIHYPARRCAAGDNVEGLYLKVVFKKAVNKKGLKERIGQSKVRKKGVSVHT